MSDPMPRTCRSTRIARQSSTMRQNTVRRLGVTPRILGTPGSVPLSPGSHSLDPMRVLGLDPGLTCAGYGLVERSDSGIKAVCFGAIRTPRGPVPGRLHAFHDELQALIVLHRPDAVAVERVLFNANTRTAMSVGQA